MPMFNSDIPGISPQACSIAAVSPSTRRTRSALENLRGYVEKSSRSDFLWARGCGTGMRAPLSLWNSWDSSNASLDHGYGRSDSQIGQKSTCTQACSESCDRPGTVCIRMNRKLKRDFIDHNIGLKMSNVTE